MQITMHMNLLIVHSFAVCDSGGPPRPGMLPTPPMGGPPMMPMMGPPPHGMMPGGPGKKHVPVTQHHTIFEGHLKCLFRVCCRISLEGKLGYICYFYRSVFQNKRHS